MLASLDRIHFFLPGDRPEVCVNLEFYFRGRVGSAFEGVSAGTRRDASPSTGTVTQTE
jgi:hypothetical protein